MVLKIIPLFAGRLTGHVDVLNQQAKLVGVSCVEQQSMATEPVGSDTVNVAAAEFKEGGLRRPCMKRAKEYVVLNVTPLGLKAETCHRCLRQAWVCVTGEMASWHSHRGICLPGG